MKCEKCQLEASHVVSTQYISEIPLCGYHTDDFLARARAKDIRLVKRIERAVVR